jgi:hypothetical protein
MSFRRIALAAAVALPLLAGVASAGTEDPCMDTFGNRIGSLVCPFIPDGID